MAGSDKTDKTEKSQEIEERIKKNELIARDLEVQVRIIEARHRLASLHKNAQAPKNKT